MSWGRVRWQSYSRDKIKESGMHMEGKGGANISALGEGKMVVTWRDVERRCTAGRAQV